MELVTTYSPKKVWNHLEDHDKKGGVALFVLPDQSSYDTFFPVVGFLQSKWGDTYNFITPLVVSTSAFSAYLLKYRDTLNHYTLIFQLPTCSNLTTFIPNTLGYTKAEYDLYLASISTYHAIAPASTTENKIPQWDSTNMFLKDGLTLATTLGTPGVDTKVPSEKAVRDALDIIVGADVSGPDTTTENKIPQWDATTKVLKDGLTLATSVADPGVDTQLVTEQGIREALNAKPTAVLTTTLATPGVDTKVPSEKAVRDALTSAIPASIVEIYPEKISLDSVDTGVDFGTIAGIVKSIDFDPDVRGAVWFNFILPSDFDIDAKDIKLKFNYMSNGGTAAQTVELEFSIWAIDSGKLPVITAPNYTFVETITLSANDIDKVYELELTGEIIRNILSSNTKEVAVKITRDGVTDTNTGTLQVSSVRLYQGTEHYYSLWCGGGWNSSGELGLNDIIRRSSPTQVGGLTDWNMIASGYKVFLAIKNNGTLWVWGYNGDGELGLNDTVSRSSPVQVGTDTNWKKISSNKECILAIKTDGTLWAWGRNQFGELGLNDIISRSSPVQVGTDIDWNIIYNGSNETLAIKTDGTLWSWGNNYYGQLGQNDTIKRSSPVQVGNLTDWNIVSINNYVCAIKNDGTLWAWGRNYIGNLGLNDIIDRSSPVQVGTLTNWKDVICGYFTTLAVKTDGTLWSYGKNQNGQLGQNDRVSRSSPVQVGNLTDWSIIGEYRAIKNDGTLWSWGNNSNGQLGLNDTVSRSSPVQIGTLTDWKDVISNNNCSIYLKD